MPDAHFPCEEFSRPTTANPATCCCRVDSSRRTPAPDHTILAPPRDYRKTNCTASFLATDTHLPAKDDAGCASPDQPPPGCIRRRDAQGFPAPLPRRSPPPPSHFQSCIAKCAPGPSECSPAFPRPPCTPMPLLPRRAESLRYQGGYTRH